MWHEARKQERKIRGMLVDYRRRAERRQDFYEKIKGDPTQFMQIHGRRCKIHLDPAIAAAGESPAIMMPWQGHQDNLIDRFDVRAHLDFIPPIPKSLQPTVEEELSSEDRQCNYERYRILAQNDFLVISEEKFLNQLYLEEQFGAQAQIELEKSRKPKPGTGAAIGYTYDDDQLPFTHNVQSTSSAASSEPKEDDDSDSDLDVDVAIDISKLDTSQAHELNACGRNFGMKSNDFYSFLTKDADEAESLRMAKEEEAEKILLSGRKSRRERRLQREKKLPGRTLSPPSYAAKEDPDPRLEEEKNESGDSRSSSPDNSGKVVYITSFGGEDELQPHSKISINLNTKPNFKNSESSLSSGISYADKVKQNLDKLKKINNFGGRSSESRKRRSPSRSRSRSHSRNRYRRSRSPYRRDRYRDRRSSRRRRKYSRSQSRRKISRSRSRVYHSRSLSTRSRSRSPKMRHKSKSKTPIKKEIQSASPIATQPILQIHEIIQPKEESPPIKRYYGRKKEDQSSSDEIDDNNDNDNAINDNENDWDTKDSTDIKDVHMTSPKSDKQTLIGLLQTHQNSSSSSSSMFGKSTVISESKHSIGVPLPGDHSASGCSSNANSTSKINPRDRLKKKMQILLNKQFVADKKAEIQRTERQIQQQQEREQEMRELALKLRRRQRELRHKYGTPTTSQSRSQSRSKSKSKSPAIPALMSLRPKLSPVQKSHNSISRSRSHSPRRTDISYRRNNRSRSRSRSFRRERDCSRDRYRDDKGHRNRDRDQDERKYKSQSKGKERERDRIRERDNDRGRDRYNDRERDQKDRDRYGNRDRNSHRDRDYNHDRNARSSYRAR